MSSGWAACLDDLEAHLDDQRTALAQGQAERITAFRPPAALGPLPGELEPRARALEVAMRCLADDVALALAAVARQLQLAAVLGPAQHGSRFIDTRG